MKQIGWAYNDTRWDDTRWHMCADKPREINGRQIKPVFIDPPKIKSLEWAQNYEGDFSATTIAGRYHVWEIPGIGWDFVFRYNVIQSGFNAPDFAKAAAQSHYENLIRSVLE